MTGIVVAALLGSQALAQEPPPASRVWAAHLRAAYAHYADIEFQFLPVAPAGPVCPRSDGRPPPADAPGVDPDFRARFLADPAAVAAACGAMAHDTWMLRANLTPGDQRVFSAGWVRVAPIPEGQDAGTWLSRAVDSGAVASRFFQYTLPVGGYLVDLHLPCGATGLAGYEVADLVAALRVATGEPIDKVGVSPCGRTWYSLEEGDRLVEAGKQPREYFGLNFPEVRDQHRATRPQTEAAP